MVTWVTQEFRAFINFRVFLRLRFLEMLHNGDDDSAFALDCMESNGVRPRTA